MKHIVPLLTLFLVVGACSKGRQYPVPARPVMGPNPGASGAAVAQAAKKLTVDTSGDVLKILGDGKILLEIPSAKPVVANDNFVEYSYMGPGGEEMYDVFSREKRQVIYGCDACKMEINTTFVVAKNTKSRPNKDGLQLFRTVAFDRQGEMVFDVSAENQDAIKTAMSETYVAYASSTESVLYNIAKGRVMLMSSEVKIELNGKKAIVWTDGDKSKTYDEAGN